MRILVLALLALLYGCSTQPMRSPTEVSVGAPAPVAAHPPILVEAAPPKADKAVMPYRDFFTPTMHKKPSLGLQSFVIFTHRPTSEEERDLYVKVCKHWEAELETYASVKPYAVDLKLTPLYWPTAVANPSSIGCKHLYAYNYALAASIASSSGVSQTHKGPLLILKQGQDTVVLDMSRFQPDDLARAFQIWKQQVCSANPVSARFTILRFREHFRSLVQVYGETILKYLEKVG